MKKLLKRDYVRFCIVGGLGFTINFVLITILYKLLHMPLFFAQLIAGEIALFNNFILHHNWTYKGHNVKKTIPTLLWQFHATSWMAVLGIAFLVSGGVQYLHLNYVVALFIGAVGGLIWNFFWTKFIIWHHEHSVVEEGHGVV